MEGVTLVVGNSHKTQIPDLVSTPHLPYHGEIFIDPDTGVVVRLITQAEFKGNEVVHQEDQRIDFAPVPVGSKSLVLPIKTVIDTEVVPNGDSQAAGKFSLRRTMFTSEYKDYQAGS